MSPAMKGRLIPANPIRAIGIFSSSLISSIFELKYSSGSFSLVSGLRSSPSPNILRDVMEVIALGLFDTASGADGLNALAHAAMIAKRTAMYAKRFILYIN